MGSTQWSLRGIASFRAIIKNRQLSWCHELTHVEHVHYRILLQHFLDEKLAYNADTCVRFRASVSSGRA